MRSVGLHQCSTATVPAAGIAKCDQSSPAGSRLLGKNQIPVQWVQQPGVPWEEERERNVQLGAIKHLLKLFMNLPRGWKFQQVGGRTTLR